MRYLYPLGYFKLCVLIDYAILGSLGEKAARKRRSFCRLVSSFLARKPPIPAAFKARAYGMEGGGGGLRRSMSRLLSNLREKSIYLLGLVVIQQEPRDQNSQKRRPLNSLDVYPLFVPHVLWMLDPESSNLGVMGRSLKSDPRVSGSPSKGMWGMLSLMQPVYVGYIRSSNLGLTLGSNPESLVYGR